MGALFSCFGADSKTPRTPAPASTPVTLQDKPSSPRQQAIQVPYQPPKQSAVQQTKNNSVPHQNGNGAVAPRKAPSTLASYGYKKVQNVGAGAYGEVALVEHVQTGKLYAMKLIERGHKVDRAVRTEIKLHRRIFHPHVIQFREAFLLPDHLAIVMEYAEGGDMFNWVTSRQYPDGTKGRLKEDEARWYFQQLILAIDYLHQLDVASRDIKLENCLLVPVPNRSRDYQLMKLCDFGTAKDLATAQANTLVGTLPYMSPEVLTAVGGYDPKLADCWSCGVFLYTILCGKYSHGDAPNYKTKVKFPPWVSVSKEAEDLTLRLLTVDPKQRATIEDVKKHPWFLHRLPPNAFGSSARRIGPQSDADTQALEQLLRAAATKSKPSFRRDSNTGAHH